jgi:ABC-type spermidine/putrescine transport system permease subunit II
MDTHAVSGGGGTGLQVAAAGPTAVASVVLVRGYSQSRLSRRTPFGFPGGTEPVVLSFVTFSLPFARVVVSSVVGDSPGAYRGQNAQSGRSDAVSSPRA